MKKIYNAPTSFCVELRTTNMMALSLMGGGDSVSSSNSSEFEQNVKENYPPISDKNVWDEEW